MMIEIDDRRHIEAILMVAEAPIPEGVLAQVLEAPVDDIRDALGELRSNYEAESRGFVLREVAGGWRFYSHPDSAAHVERFVLTSHNPRLSAAALETLAIVAYRQPISRMQIGEIRGVNSDQVVRTLTLRGLVEPVAHDDGPGAAVLFGTTPTFLERMGLRSIEDMPPLADFVPPADKAAEYDAALGVDGGVGNPDIAARLARGFARIKAEADG